MGKRRRGLVLGCGGTLGAAWTVATLFEASRALGWDPRSADVLLGTSAGSGLAMLLGAGVSVEALLDAQLGAPSATRSVARYFATPPPTWPSPKLGRPSSIGRVWSAMRGAPLLAALTGLLPEGREDASFIDALVDAHVAPGSWVPHQGTRIVAANLATGARVVFGGARAPSVAMRDAVRASWAIPGFFPSVSLGGLRCVDGGIVSPVSVDLAAEEGLDELVVLAPMASAKPFARRGLGRIEGMVRAGMSSTVHAEVAKARRKGAKVLLLEPLEEDLEVMGPLFMDGSRRLAVLESSLRTARRNVRRSLAASRSEGLFATSHSEARIGGAQPWQV
jgi:NTE family protein